MNFCQLGVSPKITAKWLSSIYDKWFKSGSLIEKSIFCKEKSWIKQIANKFTGKQIVHILHIGKTGGSAVKEALKPYLFAGKFKIESHDHGFRLKDVPKGEKVVFFLRDPIKRFISGFYSRKRKGQPRYNFPWSSGEKKAFVHFKTPNALAVALSSENKQLKESAVMAMKNITHVNTSYWDWFDSDTYFLSRFSDILFIGFQESLRDDFNMLKRILDLPKNLKLSNDDVVAHRNPGYLDTHLDAEAMKNLITWYQNDYEFFKFCKKKVKQVNQNDLIREIQITRIDG